MTIETDIIAQIAEKYRHFGQADLVAMLADQDAQAALVTDIRALASSATGEHEGLGLEVSLIDVFGAWGEREARDTAMLIDLCLGAALEQLVPFVDQGHSRLWPAEVEIKAASMERLADSGRIVRLQPEVNVWRVRLLPPPEETDGEINDEWAKLGWIRRHITAFYDYHSYYETLSDSIGETPGSTEFHEERRKLGRALLDLLDDYFLTQPDAPRDLLPGENASDENTPEKQNDGLPLQGDNSEAPGDQA